MKRLHLLAAIATTTFAFLSNALPVHAATSASRHGFTWSFSSDRPTGTFANGDPWVLGPVTITKITPGDSAGRNGSMRDPAPNSQQGYTSQIINGGQTYNSGNDVARQLPLTIGNATSIVSSQTPPSFVSGGSISDKYAVLTVLMTQPAAGSFRPPYHGTDKTIPGNISQLNYGKLPSLAPVAGALDLATVTSWYEPIHYDHYSGWDNTHTAARMQSPGYGRQLADWYSHGLLHLCLNHSRAQKEPLLIRLIQQGIDNWGFVKNGGNYYHDGGHQFGRKAVALLAAHMLDDAAMLQTVSQPGKFQEDQQTWVVTQADVGRVVMSGYPYTQSDVGMAEWGVRHYYEQNRDDSRWSTSGTPYRFVCGHAMLAGALWGNIMGIRGKWNWEPYFLYCDRFWARENGNRGSWTPSPSSSSPNAIHVFVANMWEAYRQNTPQTSTVGSPSFGPAPGNYSNAQNVTISSATSGATIRYTTNGNTPTSSSGILYSSPVPISATTTLKAIAYKSGMVDSSVETALYTFGDYATTTSSAAFLNVPLDKTYTQQFTVEWEATPSTDNIDALMGLSRGAVSAPTGLACIARFNPSGQIDARNGGGYAAANAQNYSAGIRYHFRLVVNGFSPGAYDLFVKPSGGSEMKIADAYAFRTDQASITSLGNLGLSSPTGSISVSNVITTTAEVTRPSAPKRLRIAR